MNHMIGILYSIIEVIQTWLYVFSNKCLYIFNFVIMKLQQEDPQKGSFLICFFWC